MAKFDYDAMDTAAEKALEELEELEKLHPEAFRIFVTWLQLWYHTAGYKRLCRGLLRLADRRF